MVACDLEGVGSYGLNDKVAVALPVPCFSGDRQAAAGGVQTLSPGGEGKGSL
jgi:hypothetical protein